MVVALERGEASVREGTRWTFAGVGRRDLPRLASTGVGKARTVFPWVAAAAMQENIAAITSDLTQQRQQADALLDLLPADKLNAVQSLLEVMVEPRS